MTQPIKAEEAGLVVAGWLQRNTGWHKIEVIQSGAGLTYAQARNGMQWFRRFGGVALGHTIVCDKRTDTYALCDEFGRPTDSQSLTGYDERISRDSASRAMTQYGVALTAFNRADEDDLNLERATYRKRVRGLRDVLESYSEEAERIGLVKEVERIEAFLQLNSSP